MSEATIWKFQFTIGDVVKLEMPMSARLLHVGLDPSGTPCMWAAVVPDMPTMIYTFHVAGTGHPLSGEHGRHLGSFVQGQFVWHLFLDAALSGRADGQAEVSR